MGNLILRTILGFVFLLAVLALVLFISAGSLSFWQAWVYLAVFAVCVILITLYLVRYDRELLEGRVKAGPISETQKSQQLIQSAASLFFIALFLVSGLDFRFHWSAVPLALVWVSEGMVAIGSFIVFLVFRENSYTRGTIEVSEKQTVVSSGPYRVVRHPMYSGALLMLLFSGLSLGSFVALLCVIPLISVIALRAIDEEKFLEAHLPGYKEYRQRVRYRLIPVVW
jgi:protein-S-isoprenylcysteine O-methyltransferase Ste14